MNEVVEYNYYFGYHNAVYNTIHITPYTFIVNSQLQSWHHSNEQDTYIIGQFVSSLKFQTILKQNRMYCFYIFKVPKSIHYERLKDICNVYVNNLDLNYFNTFDITMYTFKIQESDVNDIIYQHLNYEKNNSNPFDKRIFLKSIDSTEKCMLSLYTHLKYETNMSTINDTTKKYVYVNTPVFKLKV